MSRTHRLAMLVVFASLLVVPAARAQLTVPERTKGERTSTHAEVLAFIDSLKQHGAKMTVGTLGESPKGKRLPYVILARPMVTTPAAAKATGKPVFYIEGNIHAGEVEGKEAVQMLMRDLTIGKLKPLLDSVIVIFVPIYNADGNDAFGPQDLNRSEQVGPEMVGLRANGQGYDLNRDYIKQEAPETRASLALIARWDPDMFMDLHTTDGSYHGYALTWSPGLNPNHTPTNDWVTDTVLEQVRKRVRDRHHFETYPYGNFDGGNTTPTGWRTYESLPRYGSNLAGMTRISVLSEAMSHDPFIRRIDATYAFILETMRYLNEHKVEMRRHVALTAKYRPDSVVVRGDSLGASPVRMDTVLVAVTKPVTLPRSDSALRANSPRTPQVQNIIGCSAATPPAGRGPGNNPGRGGAGTTTRTVQEMTGEFRPVFMQVRDRFGPVRKEAIAAAYVFGPEYAPVVELMRRQGIVVSKTTAAWSGPVGQFRVDSVRHSTRQFEGHCGVLLEGAWMAPASESIPAGSFIVSTNQRMGMLAAFLLEPASEDGYVNWNFFDAGVKQGSSAPVKRLAKMPAIKMVAVP